MTANNQLALIVSYYLSRCDKEGYANLGYSSFNQAARDVGKILSVKPNTIKNMRDEFDPYHNNARIGWKRELRGSRLKVLKAFQETDEETLLEIVEEILNNKEFKNTEEYEDIHTLFRDKETGKAKKAAVFILRGPTGKAAEQFFVEYFKNSAKPVSGELVDCRDLGCGYDFEIKSGSQSYMIEVKGLTLSGGGVLFTNKEWQTALKYKSKYFLVLIKNLSLTPELIIINDPASKLRVRRNIYTTIQVSWSADEKSLMQTLKKT